MQIGSNTTGMPAGLTVTTDKTGRECCVVVVKGTFSTGARGTTQLADEQVPLVHADEHFGDPANTSTRYECDFALFKPRADILIHGRAFSPTGKAVEKLTVTLEVERLRKDVLVVGDRHWEQGLWGLRASAITPFVQMPLIYERAFGGLDHSHPDARYQGTELRNPVGVGFRMSSEPKHAEGVALPNLEHPLHPIRTWKDTPPPTGFGSLGRSWLPRLTYAGTYDERWMRETRPLLPDDFDPQYFLSAPVDQQTRYLQGGERIRCTQMTPEGQWVVQVPVIRVPITFRFRQEDRQVTPLLDTVLLEPDRRRMVLTWRASVPLVRKLTVLREVLIGPRRRLNPPEIIQGKLRFKSMGDLVAWRQQNRGGWGNDLRATPHHGGRNGMPRWARRELGLRGYSRLHRPIQRTSLPGQQRKSHYRLICRTAAL